MAPAAEEALGRLVTRVRAVRRWLVLLSVLKAAALSFAFVAAYVAVYAYVDHHVHMGVVPRLAALSLLIIGALFVLYALVRSLVRHISYSRAANHIEGKINLDQQLVTAIEYYESKGDYPYSEPLANYVVRRVYAASAGTDLESTVAKWQAYLFAAVIFVGLCCVGLFMHSHYVFFSTYLARLARPLGDVEPLPATTLFAITKDIVAPPDSRIALAAGIRGRTPANGSLVIEDDSAGTAVDRTQIVEVGPKYDEEGHPQFRETVSLMLGDYRYRFEAEAAATDWHDIRICSTPKIKNMTARVTVPGSSLLEAYTERIKGSTLGLIRDSQVELRVETTEQLSEAHVTRLDGRTMALRLRGADAFSVSFAADREGRIGFELVGEAGIPNRNVPPLRVVFRENETPRFKLVSPEGDYVATNVASVPVAFEVTDDFGLEAAVMYFELPGGDLRQVLIPVKKGARSATGGYALELEDYELRVGDSIVLYAEAMDIETAIKKIGRPRSKSDVYFVEIMPYRISWVPPSLGVRPPDKKKQPDKKQTHDALIHVLEYTRAILKKTWGIARKDDISKEDRARLDSIDEDVTYCTEQLVLIRDDPRSGLDRGDVSAVNRILGDFDDASYHLSRHNAASAIPPENKAYRGLRKLVDETWKKLCPPGSGTPPERPDRLRLAEHAHLRRYDSKRIHRELKRLADSVAETAAEQEKVQREFDHFLAQQLQGAAYRQTTTDERSWMDPNAPRPDGDSRRSQRRPGPSPGANVSVEGSLLQAPPGATASRAAGVWPAAQSASAKKASPQDRMRMLRARESALREQASRLRDALARLPGPSGGRVATSSRGTRRAQAEGQLGQAVRSMDQFEKLIREAGYKSLEQNESLDEASRALDAASKALALARDALYQELRDIQPAELASAYRDMADRLFQLAEAFEGESTPEEMSRMLAELQDAEQLSAQIAQMQSGSGSSRTRGSGRSAPFRGTPNQQAYYHMEPAPRARLLANRFLTLALQAAKGQSELLDREPSDADMYRLENAFFEQAAKYTNEADGE